MLVCSVITYTQADGASAQCNNLCRSWGACTQCNNLCTELVVLVCSVITYTQAWGASAQCNNLCTKLGVALQLGSQAEGSKISALVLPPTEAYLY